MALEHVLAVAAASADLERLLSRELQAVEKAARARGAPVSLASLSADDREHVLRRLEPSQGEVFEARGRHTHEGSYGHPRFIARLGLDPRPPPLRGHRIEPVDFPERARVTARGPIDRPAWNEEAATVDTGETS